MVKYYTLRLLVNVPVGIFLLVLLTIATVLDVLLAICLAVVTHSISWAKDVAWLAKYPFKRPE